MAPITILHIDDDPEEQLILRDMLERIDPDRYEYHGMTDTWAAENYLKTSPCDAIFADHRLSPSDRYSSGANFLAYLCDQGLPGLKVLITGMDPHHLSLEVLNLIRHDNLSFVPKQTLNPGMLEQIIAEGLQREPEPSGAFKRSKFVPPTLPFSRFEEAAQALVAHIRHKYGFQMAMMTRVNGDDWQVLQVEDQGYGVKAGDVLRWADSFCSRMVVGEGPMIASDSRNVPAYQAAPVGKTLEIRAYIGIPVCRADGSLFGTLCAIDPEAKEEAIEQDLSEILMCAQMLGTILEQEMVTQELERGREASLAESRADALTGLYNRRGWDLMVESEEKRCRRYGHPCTVLMIDLDGLKDINDTDGHDAGDLLIQNAAHAIRDTLRREDVAARIGGDEFAVLAIETAAVAGEALKVRLKQGLAARGVSASIGLALRSDAGSLEAACKQADESMYADKQARKAGG